MAVKQGFQAAAELAVPRESGLWSRLTHKLAVQQQ